MTTGYVPGRGRRDRRTTHCQVSRDILCSQGHRVGVAWKYIPPDPRTGYHVSRMSFIETPAGGKVERICPRCGDRVEITWARIVHALDEGQRDGTVTGVFGPHSS